MKIPFVKQLCPVVLLALGSLTAQAAQLSGEITFDGIAFLNGSLATASAYTNIMSPGGPGTGGPVVTAAIGDYAGTVGEHADFTAFSFTPAPISPFQLWSFTHNAINYSFVATSVSSYQNSSFLHVYGNGIAYGNFDPTPATWSYTDTGVDPYFTFGAAIVAVPEPSTAALMTVIGMMALASRRVRSTR